MSGIGGHVRRNAQRLIAQLISSIGWVLVAIIMLIVFFGISSGSVGGSFILPMILFSIIGITAGLSLVISGQLTRAIVDNANTSAEILSLLRKITNKMGAS